MKVIKEITFDAGHRLMHHKGLCRNLHGHTYHLSLSIEGGVNKETGMVIDFKDLKSAIVSVVDQLDHAMILNSEDKKHIDFVVDLGHKFVLIKGEPTAENIALFIKEEIYHSLTEYFGRNEIIVTLKETPTSAVIA